jgi:ankyrin repeat protein
MTAAEGAPPALPDRPSEEFLRKEAKRLGKAEGLSLAAAQRRLAAEYGFLGWTELLSHVRALRGNQQPALSPLAAAAKAGDADAVRRLLAAGAAVDGERTDPGSPLWLACASDAPDAARIAVVAALLAAKADLHRDKPGETALHAAAERGSLALVELLIRHGAIEWLSDRKGRWPAERARRGNAPDRAAIAELLQRPVIRDPSFRAAVSAITTGDLPALERLLDAEPRLLRDRILEPDCYREANRPQYFRDPKLFWFVAGNPVPETMPPKMTAIARAMIARGVDQADLDYALGLVMTSSTAEATGQQGALMTLLRAAGAIVTPETIEVALGHRQTGPVEELLAAGLPMTLAIAAGLGRTDDAERLLPAASRDEIQSAFGLAIINRENGIARLLLDAGADPNGFLPVHRHSLPLHQAAIDENLDLMPLLLDRGARLDIPDTMWGSTPLGWARHEGKARSIAFLESLPAKRDD